MGNLENFIQRFKSVRRDTVLSQSDQPGFCVAKPNGQTLWVWVKFQPVSELVMIRYMISPWVGTEKPEYNQAMGTGEEIIELIKGMYHIDLTVKPWNFYRGKP